MSTELISSEQAIQVNDRRQRLRQAALAYAGLGLLGMLNSFFGEVAPRSTSVIWLSLGALFILASAMLVALDVRLRGVALSVWLARLLIVPSAWAMFSFVAYGLVGYRLHLVREPVLQHWLQMQQPAALVNAGLLSIIIVMLAQAGFGHDPTQNHR